MANSAPCVLPTQPVIQSDLLGLFRGAIGLVLEVLLEQQVREMVGARRYERLGSRKDHLNGTYMRRLLTSMGLVQIEVPRTRTQGSPLETQPHTKPQKKNPRLASGRKRARQDVKLNAANSSLRSKYRTAVKNVEKAVLAGDKTKATELFAKMQSVVDTVADKGIFHKNKAARDKSRIAAKVKALALSA